MSTSSDDSIPQGLRISDVTVSPAVLGHGALATVFEGTWHGAPVAVKRINPVFTRPFARTPNSDRPSSFVESLQQRWAQLRAVRHPSFTVVYGLASAAEGSKAPCFVTERMNGSLQDKLESERGAKVDFRELLSIFIDVAAALEYLHSMHIAHGSLSTRNILLSSGEIGSRAGGSFPRQTRAKVADLLESHTLLNDLSDTVLRLKRLPQSLAFAAVSTLECLRREQAMQPSATDDVYSFGVVMLSAIADQEPHLHSDTIAWLLGVEKAKPQDAAAKSTMLSKVNDDHPLKALITKCINIDPAERPGIREIREDLVRHQETCALWQSVSLNDHQFVFISESHRRGSVHDNFCRNMGRRGCGHESNCPAV